MVQAEAGALTIKPAIQILIGANVPEVGWEYIPPWVPNSVRIHTRLSEYLVPAKYPRHTRDICISCLVVIFRWYHENRDSLFWGCENLQQIPARFLHSSAGK